MADEKQALHVDHVGVLRQLRPRIWSVVSLRESQDSQLVVEAVAYSSPQLS